MGHNSFQSNLHTTINIVFNNLSFEQCNITIFQANFEMRINYFFLCLWLNDQGLWLNTYLRNPKENHNDAIRKDVLSYQHWHIS